jgi:hypothetical protein
MNTRGDLVMVDLVGEELVSWVGGPGELDGALNGVLDGVLDGVFDGQLDGRPDGGLNSEHQTPRQEGSRSNLNSRFGLESGSGWSRVGVGFE